MLSNEVMNRLVELAKEQKADHPALERVALYCQSLCKRGQDFKLEEKTLLAALINTLEEKVHVLTFYGFKGFAVNGYLLALMDSLGVKSFRVWSHPYSMEAIMNVTRTVFFNDAEYSRHRECEDLGDYLDDVYGSHDYSECDIEAIHYIMRNKYAICGTVEKHLEGSNEDIYGIDFWRGV